MKTLLKLLGALLVVLVLAAVGGFLYFKMTFPRVSPPPNITVEATPEMVERGRYLAHHVALCVDCHSERSWQYFAGPLKPGTLGQGGEAFTEEMGLPGDIYAKNITPAAIGNWTDGELLRAVTAGVSKDGTPLFPIMPWPNYNRMDERDVHAILAYIRTLAPIENKVKERRLIVPLNVIVYTMPKDPAFTNRPDPSDTVAYGKYMTMVASCSECHTPFEQGTPLPGMDFAGGQAFGLPDGSVVRSANITPHPENGIGGWDRAFFIERFKRHAKPEAAQVKPETMGFNTVMPWLMYAGMTEQDLGAIYEYLRTVKPVSNKVERFTQKK